MVRVRNRALSGWPKHWAESYGMPSVKEPHKYSSRALLNWAISNFLKANANNKLRRKDNSPLSKFDSIMFYPFLLINFSILQFFVYFWNILTILDSPATLLICDIWTHPSMGICCCQSQPWQSWWASFASKVAQWHPYYHGKCQKNRAEEWPLGIWKLILTPGEI